jgi:D-beta-D-heptose 7-phosphate kinase/D-beta-D-heptose 1-phosphate adenosyltransferase
MKNVWVNGCFDILHRGHIELLKYASSLGDRLIVGIDSDFRIKSNKGIDRPINTQDERKYMLESIRYVDKVYIFDTDYQLSMYIQDLSPLHMVVGEEYKNQVVIGSEHCSQLTFFPKIDGLSTSEIIKTIKYEPKTRNL